MDFLVLFLVVAVALALCFLGMAVGVIIKDKPFTSCGNAGLEIKGERVRCPGCLFRDKDKPPGYCKQEREEPQADA